MFPPRGDPQAEHPRNTLALNAHMVDLQSLLNQRATKPKLFHSYVKHKISRPTVPFPINDQLTDAKIMAERFVWICIYNLR